jgi:hypothetical protein
LHGLHAAAHGLQAPQAAAQGLQPPQALHPPHPPQAPQAAAAARRGTTHSAAHGLHPPQAAQPPQAPQASQAPQPAAIPLAGAGTASGFSSAGWLFDTQAGAAELATATVAASNTPVPTIAGITVWVSRVLLV